jgi:hypothetical protein
MWPFEFRAFKNYLGFSASDLTLPFCLTQSNIAGIACLPVGR